MKTLPLIVSALFASALGAQTQLVRGDVDSIRGTNLFRLDCTNIQLVSNTVNLQQLHDRSRQQDIEYEMQVTGGPTVLNVISARQIPEIFDMGNLRLGRSDSWEVLGTPGSAAAVFLTGTSMTSYGPFGGVGTWLLGGTFVMVNQGTIGSFGRFQFQFQPPNLPNLVGASFTAQAITRDTNGGLLITNPDCKEVRSN